MGDQVENQSNPSKLRSACDSCNSGKVKCSGERDGCTRCSSLQVPCIYGESRMGKVQGPRKRRKTANEGISSNESRSNSVSTGIQTEETTHEDSARRRSTISIPTLPNKHAVSQTSLEDSLESWVSAPWTETTWDDTMISLDTPIGMFPDVYSHRPNDPHNGSGSADSIECSSSTGSHLPFPAGAVPSIASVSGTTSSTSESILPRTSFPQLSTPISIPSTRPALPVTGISTTTSARSMARMDSKCVLACTQIIITLENYLLSELKVLDLILSAVRSVSEELRKLAQYQQESRCHRCILLFITIMHQTIELLRVGSKIAFAENASNNGIGELDTSDTEEDFMPKFGFGAFSINSEEQRSWRAHMIRKELNNTAEISGRIKAIAKLGPKHSPPPTEVELMARGKCMDDIDLQLRAMIDRVGV